MKNCYLLSILLFFILNAEFGWSQTPGLIVKSASAIGKPVLDPNGDGYVSTSNAGFIANDQNESEIKFKRLTLPESEPTSDLANGPSCGFTDFVDALNIDPVSSALDASNNLIFRFRLGGYAPNAKGYSILIDTDNKFGSTGASADPNYVTGNPGFEVEIELVTNFGVRLYNIDGKNGTTLLATDLKTTLPYDDYAQKSIAYTTNCGNADYFYDFYMPFSVITSYIPSFTPTTPIRMAANTVISTLSVLRGPVSDVGGLNDAKYGGNLENAWTAVMNGTVPTPMSTIGSGGSYPPLRSVAPTISGPISSGATTVSGTSTAANGTIITVYVNGVSAGTTTVSGGTWTRTGLSALVSNASITATATESGKSESLASGAVIVGSTCSNPIATITCTSNKGMGGTVSSGTPVGSTIRVYNASGTLIGTDPTKADFTFLYNCAGGTTNCTGGGPNCIADSSYYLTLQETGKCESAPFFVCIGGTATTSPAITFPTTISSTTTSVSGTAVNNATVYLYRNGYQIATTTASGTGIWSINSLTFAVGQVITARAQSGTQCLSSASASKTVGDVSTAPVITGPIANGATSVSGTSVEAAGTSIIVYKNGVSIGTTTVSANGTWTLAGIAVPLITSNSITATATAPGETVSAFSSAIVVQGKTSVVPTITGSYTEGQTSVTGTITAANGTVITLYIDGVSLGTTTVSSNSWTVSGLNAAFYDLYAGGVLTATATSTGLLEGPVSNSVTVACSLPLNKTISAVATQICESTTAQVKVLSSEAGIIYTLRNGTNTSNLSTSLLGTGSDIVFNSFTFTANQTVQLQALKIPVTGCSNISSSTAAITVNPNPPTNNPVVFPTKVNPGNSASFDVQNTTNGFRYQLLDKATDANVGSPVVSNSNGATVTLATGPVSSSKTYNIQVTDITKPTNCTSKFSADYFVPLPVDLLFFRAAAVGLEVKLSWATAWEKNNRSFSVERSANGKDFETIYTLPGVGTSSNTNTYSFTDSIPLPGESYYRLLQQGVDGKATYSKTVSVRMSSSNETIVLMHPNPTATYVDLEFKSPVAEETSIDISSITGKKQLIVRQWVKAGSTTIRINISDLKSGTYLVKIRNGRFSTTQKLIKLL